MANGSPGSRKPKQWDHRTSPTAKGLTDLRATATDPPGPDHGEGRLRAPQTARRTHRAQNRSREIHRAPTTGKDAFGRPKPRDGPIWPRPRRRTPSGAPNRATDHEPPNHGSRTHRASELGRRTHRAPNHGDRLLREPRTAATDPPGPHPRQRDPPGPDLRGRTPSGAPNRGDGPTGPRPTGKGSFGSSEPQRRTHQGPSANGSRKATDPRAGGQTAQAAGSGSEGKSVPPRRYGDVFRTAPSGALQRARPSERPRLRARQTEEPTARPPPGGKRVDGTGGPLGARQRAGRTGPKPLGATARPGHASDADSTRFGGATKRPNPWPALSGPSGPRGAATRHSSERRREGIRTSLGPSPREYRAVCQWKRRQARNGLRSGAMP
jgi:hypothetical protein